MQEERKNTPKLGTIRKVRNASTSETGRGNVLDFNISRIGSRNRTTMMPSDIAQLQMISKKKADTDAKDVELGLLYDEYLQTITMDLIMKKKTEEKKRLMVEHVATVAKEIDRDTQKLMKIKARERDIITLSLAQKEADAQLIAVTRCTGDETFKRVKDMSSKLHALLEPLDVVRCTGIRLPETQDEWKETREILIKCSNALKNIETLIGSKGETYRAVDAGLKDFAETYNEIKDVQTKLEEALCTLQVVILKNASLSLVCNESG
ncbi:uncharacterized protein LOC143894557 isoform X2 [Temnothorax americanus]|uniref:uncharacterized protein LOC143894557 isoform X2 n=1 Tax=Temnothorax americanus TaxID=1964332 RepID=UPI004068B3F9